MKRIDIDRNKFHWEKTPAPARSHGIGPGRDLGAGRHTFRYDPKTGDMVEVGGPPKGRNSCPVEFTSWNAGVAPDQVADANRTYCQDGVKFDERGKLHCPGGRRQFLRHLEKRGLHSNTEQCGGRDYSGPGPGTGYVPTD